jgi:NTE family protein
MIDQGRHKVALALQGGGSHGAYTWGVLDRLLEHTAIDVAGVTGTSAGAMNGAVLVDGLVRGGKQQARDKLRQFWEAVGAMPGFGSLFWHVPGKVAATMRLESIPAYAAFEMMSRHFSPYTYFPSNYSPLRPLLTKLIDFERLRAQEEVQLIVCATNARTARRRVFTNQDVTVDALLASACMPQLLPAVEIDGEPYWDGSFTGNPAFGPLLRKITECDLIIIRVDPVSRREAPRTMRDIFDRTVEISQNSTFWLELSAVAVVLRLVDQGLIDRTQLGRIRFHGIEASPAMEEFPTSSKLNNYPALLEYLFDLGRQAGDAWLVQNETAIGQRSTIDLRQLLPVDV